MKRLFVIPLVGVMLAILAVPVLAEGNTDKIESSTGVSHINVLGTVESDNTVADVYSVDITWGNMHAVYVPRRTQVWDPTRHNYVDGDETTKWEWMSTTDKNLQPNQVKITNHSNVSIMCNLEFNHWIDFDSVSGSFSDNGKGGIGTAANYIDRTDEDSISQLTRSFYLTLSGSIPNGTDGSKIGEISITIDKQ